MKHTIFYYLVHLKGYPLDCKFCKDVNLSSGLLGGVYIGQLIYRSGGLTRLADIFLGVCMMGATNYIYMETKKDLAHLGDISILESDVFD